MIEVMTFRLAKGVSDQQFLAADRRLQTKHSPRQHGLLRRTTGQTDSGDWVAVIHWQSAEDHAAAMKTWGTDDITKDFVGHLDLGTVVSKLYTTYPGVLGTT